MLARNPARYRLMVWMDAAENITQAALARYWYDVKDSETTWTPGPFDTIEEIRSEARRVVAGLPTPLQLEFE